MDNNFTPNYVITNRSEFFGIACLAIIGAISIIGNVASSAYRFGRETKETEMKRDFKRYLKKHKKERP